ncbi:MAG: sensor histidine kinase, partial [Bauldia sp.]|nr:sensor histidine kinase [Bauldia sp.]
MAIRIDTQPSEKTAEENGTGRRGAIRRALAGMLGLVPAHAFSSITRRIVILNLAGLIVLVVGILGVRQFQQGLIDAKVQSLTTQGEIIAAAIAGSATVETNIITIDPEELLEQYGGEFAWPFGQAVEGIDFPINPTRVAPLLRRLVSPTGTRARIYDTDGVLLVDSRELSLGGRIYVRDLPPIGDPSALDRFTQWISLLFRGDRPLYEELGRDADGRQYPEVAAAMGSGPQSIVRATEAGQLMVSVAVPVQRTRRVLGVLLLSTEGGDIDAIVQGERLNIFRVALVAAGVTVLLSILLAGTIAVPLRRLADAADNVRKGVRSRQQVPDFSGRRDEIGHLGQAFRDMTAALYNRIEAIESFAADVSHELKNPLTSLRSAVETLPLAKSEESKARLTAIIQHDVRRLNRLITDISDASRLDAELARQEEITMDLAQLARTVVNIARETRKPDEPKIELVVAPADKAAYMVVGHDSRLGQVLGNLLDNARSFCRSDGTVRVILRRLGERVELGVEDDGPGIRPDQMERIFERFYTDRPDGESFGQNSGLGLSISKQIVEAHRGEIFAENRVRPKVGAPPGSPPEVCGARFVVRLPA